MNTVLLLITVMIGCLGIKPIYSTVEPLNKKCPVLEKGACPKADEITYWLTSSSSKDVQVQLRLETLQKAPFVKGPLKIVSPGYRNQHNVSLALEWSKSYLSRGQSNVLVIDWYTYTKKGCYMHAIQSVPAVAKCIAQFISNLLKVHPNDNVHLMGVSLGTYLAAFISVELPSLERLTKLDPGRPLLPKKRGAAKFIDVYHSNTNIYGEKGPSGDVDVYFNTALYQPGCKCDLLCSHLRATIYFMESISKPMAAFPCKGWNDYLTGKCSKPKPTDLVNVGEGIDMKTRGVFMAFTKEKAPFIEPNDVYTSTSNFESFKKTLTQEKCDSTKDENLAKDFAAGIC